MARVQGENLCWNQKFEVVCTEMLFKVLELDEIAQGDSVYRKTKTESKRAFWNIPP